MAIIDRHGNTLGICGACDRKTANEACCDGTPFEPFEGGELAPCRSMHGHTLEWVATKDGATFWECRLCQVRIRATLTDNTRVRAVERDVSGTVVGAMSAHPMTGAAMLLVHWDDNIQHSPTPIHKVVPCRLLQNVPVR